MAKATKLERLIAKCNREATGESKPRKKAMKKPMKKAGKKAKNMRPPSRQERRAADRESVKWFYSLFKPKAK